MGTTWAGIVRVSHMGGRRADAADFHSEREQIEAMRGAVQRVGGSLEVLPSELDVSGGLPLDKRPSLLAAVEGVEAGRFCGIVVAYQSRLGRDTEYEEAVWRRVEAAGGRIEMAMDGLDTSTVDGKMVRRIRSAMNAAERERHVKRFDELREWATKAGVWQVRQVPLGYVKGPDRKLIPGATEDVERVKRAFTAAGSGVPLVRIADELGRTPGGTRHLLRNRVYLGELRSGKYVNPSAHEPLVTVDEFEAAQTSSPRPARGASGAPALLAGIVRCQGCGHVMSRGKAAAVVYTCNGRSSAGRCPSPTAVTVALLDEFVERIALGELGRLSISAADSHDRIDTAREDLAVAERELAAYLEAVSADSIGVRAFADGAKVRSDRIDEARAVLQRELGLRPIAPGFADGRAVWERLDGHARNALLRALLEVVIVRRGGGRGSRTPLSERVRVIAAGTGLVDGTRHGERAAGIVELPFPDIDGEGVLRVAGGEDAL